MIAATLEITQDALRIVAARVPFTKLFNFVLMNKCTAVDLVRRNISKSYLPPNKTAKVG